MGVVVDSSIFIAAERGKFDWVAFHSQWGAEPLFITVLTLAELQHGVETRQFAGSARNADEVPGGN
jgi:predicted nucleic acid-binding protein